MKVSSIRQFRNEGDNLTELSFAKTSETVTKDMGKTWPIATNRRVPSNDLPETIVGHIRLQFPSCF